MRLEKTYKPTYSDATFIEGGVDFDKFPAATLSPEQEYDQLELQKQFAKVISTFTKRGSSILSDYYFTNQDRTLKDIGQIWDVSPYRIGQILEKSYRQMKKRPSKNRFIDGYAITDIESAKASALFGADEINLRDDAAKSLTEKISNAPNIDDDSASYLGKTIETAQDEFMLYDNQENEPFQSEALADAWANSQDTDDIDSPPALSDEDIAHEKAVYKFVAKTQSASTAQMFKREFTLD